jgi:hypothetical protein
MCPVHRRDHVVYAVHVCSTNWHIFQSARQMVNIFIILEQEHRERNSKCLDEHSGKHKNKFFDINKCFLLSFNYFPFNSHTYPSLFHVRNNIIFSYFFQNFHKQLFPLFCKLRHSGIEWLNGKL